MLKYQYSLSYMYVTVCPFRAANFKSCPVLSQATAPLQDRSRYMGARSAPTNRHEESGTLIFLLWAGQPTTRGMI